MLYAQAQDTIFIWDNDRGVVRHYYPAVGATNNFGYIAWQDGRVLDYDIWRTQRNWTGARMNTDRCVSPDTGGSRQQTMVDAEGNPGNGVVYVWEDSLYKGTPAPTRIMASIRGATPFVVFSGALPSKNPAVSCTDAGEFVASFTYWAATVSAIRLSRFNSAGGNLGNYSVWTQDSLRKWPPISRVAFCDSGFVVVYEDSTTANARSIFLQYRKRDGTLVVNRLKVSNPGNPTETYNEFAPAVSVNSSGYVAVVWQDERNGAVNPDIYYRTFQMEPGINNLIQNAEGIVSTASYRDERPRVTVFPVGDFFVIWHQYQGNPGTSYDIRGRVFYGTNPRATFTLNTIDTLDQIMPDVECRNSDTCYVSWMSNAASSNYDIYCRSYFKFSGTDYGMVAMFTPELMVSPDTAGGRKIWYHDDENYDNLATPGWDEDPIPEPESIYVDLDFAIVDQLMELNTNNQYFIICEDTLPPRQFGRALSFDAMFLDLGFRTDLSSAGTITMTEQATIGDFLNPSSGNGRPVMVEGNDFGSMYSGTALFSLFHADYRGDGSYYTIGNIDTLYGTTNMYAQAETLKYCYRDWADNHPDSIAPTNNGRLILQSSGALYRWAAGRSIGWENNWKRDRRSGNTEYNSFMLCGIKSNVHPHTYAEYFRRTMGFLGLNCQPEPITTLTAASGSGEGTVNLTWEIAADDSLTDPCNTGYRLKFSRVKMTSEAAYSDSSEEYYQLWNTPGQVGTLVGEGLYGLPPMDTLIFAIKVKDDMGFWDALGAEPRAVVSGDSLTPHTICVGDNLVKDFANRWELFDVRAGDSLFMTWDRNNFFVGFARCNLKVEGNLFVYFDTKTGGADSTVGYSGSTGKSAFGTAFRPDYVFIMDDSATIKYMKYSATKDGRGSWVDTTFSGRCCEDSVINGFFYSEIAVPFVNMRYDTMTGFKIQVLVQNEATNYIWNSYPPANPAGGTGLYLPYYYFAANGLRSNLVPNRGLVYIGIEEEKGYAASGSYLRITPNPFCTKININFGIGQSAKGGELNIYDITGRLVRSFSFSQALSPNPSVLIWNGTDQNGRSVPLGVYFCALQVEGKTKIVKAVYIR
jgi:hypothetical protein